MARTKDKYTDRTMYIQSDSVLDTLCLGKVLAGQLCEQDIVCLSGPLGSGKTVFAKGIAAGLGIKKSKVISPTFVLLRQYAGRKTLFHFDFYRLTEAKDIAAIGYEEYFYDRGISLIEWPERLGFLMPEECLTVRFYLRSRSKRLISLSASGTRYNSILNKIYEDLSA